MLKRIRPIWYLVILHTVSFLYVFGSKILHLNSIFFSDTYDSAKNYFTYFYYTQIQEANNGFFEGMNYPFGEYIFYTDNTPIIAFIAKFFNMGEGSIAFYNGIFLLLWFLTPFVAYKILKLLKVSAYIAIAFSWIICWTNPLLNHFGSTVNLSLFIFYLLALYFFLKHIKASNLKEQLLYVAAQIILIYVASFFHLYYLPIILLFLGGAYAIYVILNLKPIIALQALLVAGLSAIAVYGTIISIDQYYDLRPEGASGYGYSLYRNFVIDYFSSLLYLDFPSLFQYKEWGQQKWSFLGNAYPAAIIIVMLSAPFFIQKLFSKDNKVILSILFGGLICAFVSMGDTIDLKEGHYLCMNYFNPFYYVSKFTDFVTHFRFLRRFSAPFWMVYFIWLAMLSSQAWNQIVQKSKTQQWITKLHKPYIILLRAVVIIFILISGIDAVQYISFHSKNYERENFLSKKSLETAPDFKKGNFKAILPIPYFYVGSEISKYVIDDPDGWSSTLYRLSIKNKLPLMACKMCRIPDSFATKAFSVFEEKTDATMLNDMKNEKVLLAINHKEEWQNQDNPYVQQLKSSIDFLLEKHQTKFLYNREEVDYYELYLR